MTDNKNEDNSSLSLSAAILAPLNAIFEAQVHAARSFLSFILQMGFRHKYLDSDIAKLDSEKENDKKILDEIEKEKEAQNKISFLRKKQENKKLTDEEKSELDKLIYKWDDIRSQEFSYFDDDAQEHVVTIPNLALIPVKPLAIDDANIKFEMKIDQTYKSYSTIRTSTEADPIRPWFLISPKRLSGHIVPKGESNTQAGISIEINIKCTEMPYGLNRLLTTMTESSKSFPKPIGEKEEENDKE